jgi:hypothetical protein
MIRIDCELGTDCLWVVTENSELGQFDRRAFYPWEADPLTAEFSEEDWLPSALAHLASISAGSSE